MDGYTTPPMASPRTTESILTYAPARVKGKRMEYCAYCNFALSGELRRVDNAHGSSCLVHLECALRKP